MKKKHVGKVKRILAIGWKDYARTHSPIRAAVKANVFKMLACRTPLLGSHLYVCPSCGEARVIPHSCKSRFCSICGMVATENWIRKQFGFLWNCPYQHVVVTLPCELRGIAKGARHEVLNAMTRIAVSYTHLTLPTKRIV